MGNQMQSLSSGARKILLGGIALCAAVALILIGASQMSSASKPSAGDESARSKSIASNPRPSQAKPVRDDLRDAPEPDWVPEARVHEPDRAAAERLLKIIQLPINERGIKTMMIQPRSKPRPGQPAPPALIYEVDDEEWSSYELPAGHPSESFSCLNCHTRDQLPQS